MNFKYTGPDNKSAMPPNTQANTFTGVLHEADVETNDGGLARDITVLKEAGERKWELIWSQIVVFTVAHILGIYGISLIFTSAYWQTTLFAFVLHFLSILGITAGIHRLWSHRAYKARTSLKIFLALISTIAYQNSVYHWAREHRVHHKFSETNADPVNSSRGFFFSHVGWLMCKKHPDVKAKGKCVDMTDLQADKVLWFQHKNYRVLVFFFALAGPFVIPIVCWNETWFNSLCVAVMLRWICSLHSIFLVNSAAHIFGVRPYDKNLNPAENMMVSGLTLGEGFHNFHHTFPWDYKVAELGGYTLNFTTLFIDVCARLGLAYDLKTVSQEIIEKRVTRTGDGTHNLWGWGDPAQDPLERSEATISHQKQH